MKTVKEKALEIAQIMKDLKGENVTVLDVSRLNSWTDYFIIVTATSVPHLKALVGHLEEVVREKFQRRPLAVDGEPASEWVLIDFGSVLVHIMGEETRNKYELERLWSNAPQLNIAE